MVDRPQVLATFREERSVLQWFFLCQVPVLIICIARTLFVLLFKNKRFHKKYLVLNLDSFRRSMVYSILSTNLLQWHNHLNLLMRVLWKSSSTYKSEANNETPHTCHPALALISSLPFPDIPCTQFLRMQIKS